MAARRVGAAATAAAAAPCRHRPAAHSRCLAARPRRTTPTPAPAAPAPPAAALAWAPSKRQTATTNTCTTSARCPPRARRAAGASPASAAAPAARPASTTLAQAASIPAYCCRAGRPRAALSLQTAACALATTVIRWRLASLRTCACGGALWPGARGRRPLHGSVGRARLASGSGPLCCTLTGPALLPTLQLRASLQGDLRLQNEHWLLRLVRAALGVGWPARRRAAASCTGWCLCAATQRGGSGTVLPALPHRRGLRWCPPPICSPDGHFLSPNPLVVNVNGARLAMCSACEGCPTAQCGASGCTACPIPALPALVDGEVSTMTGAKAKVCRPAGGQPKVREACWPATLVPSLKQGWSAASLVQPRLLRSPMPCGLACSCHAGLCRAHQPACVGRVARRRVCGLRRQRAGACGRVHLESIGCPDRHPAPGWVRPAALALVSSSTRRPLPAAGLGSPRAGACALLAGILSPLHALCFSIRPCRIADDAVQMLANSPIRMRMAFAADSTLRIDLQWTNVTNGAAMSRTLLDALPRAQGRVCIAVDNRIPLNEPGAAGLQVRRGGAAQRLGWWAGHGCGSTVVDDPPACSHERARGLLPLLPRSHAAAAPAYHHPHLRSCT